MSEADLSQGPQNDKAALNRVATVTSEPQLRLEEIQFNEPDSVVARLGVDHPVGLVHWTSEKKQDYTPQVQAEIGTFLTALDVGVETISNIQQRFLENALLYRENIVGPVHDEYHMAKVVHWAIDIWKRRKDSLPENKRKIIALALVIAAVDHDRGDIPRKGEVFAQSQRSEARSARGASTFIDQLSVPEDIDQTELRALVNLMVATTSQSLEMSFTAESIDNLNTTKLVRDLEIDERSMADAKQEVALARVARYRLLKRDWNPEQILESVRMLNAADYASYFFEPADLIEAIALMVEKEEIYLTDDGKLAEAEGLKEGYIKFLGPDFRRKIYQFYLEYYHQKTALEIMRRLEETARRLEAVKEKTAEDRLLRLEGGLTPRSFFAVVKSLHLEDEPLVQQALVKYSVAYREAFSHPDAANFNILATDLIRALWFETGDEQKTRLFQELFDQIARKVTEDGMTIGLHLSPLAYADGFTDPDLKAMAESRQQDLSSGPDFLKELDKYLEGVYYDGPIRDISLALRVDKGDVGKIDLDTLSPRYELSLAGIPQAEEMVEAIDQIEGSCSGRKIIVHAGLNEDPEIIFEKLYQISQESANDWSLHLDGEYPAFNRWFCSKMPPENEIPSFSVIISPLVDLMNGDRDTAEAIARLKKNVPHISLSSNNAIMAGGGTQALQRLVFGFINDYQPHLASNN